MAQDRHSLASLSDVARLGLVSDRLTLNAGVHGGGGLSVPANSVSSLHYVGTSGWRDRSSGCVLLHGGSGDWRHYCSNLHRLSKSTTFVVPDLPGFGASNTPCGEDLAAIVDPISAFVRALPWDDITLVGFSFGALVAAAAAVKCRPTRLMLISPAGFGAHTPEMFEARDEAARTAKASGLRAGLAVTLHRIMLHRSSSSDDELVPMMEEMLRATRAKVRRFSRSEVILDHLRMLDCPVRVLFGASDPYHASVLGQRYSAITAACPGVQIQTVSEAAHWLMLEQPAVFEEALLKFCQEAGQ